jgi:hypothetical protein
MNLREISNLDAYFQETLADHKQNFTKGQHSDFIDAYLEEIFNEDGSTVSSNFHGKIIKVENLCGA